MEKVKPCTVIVYMAPYEREAFKRYCRKKGQSMQGLLRMLIRRLGGIEDDPPCLAWRQQRYRERDRAVQDREDEVRAAPLVKEMEAELVPERMWKYKKLGKEYVGSEVEVKLMLRAGVLEKKDIVGRA